MRPNVLVIEDSISQRRLVSDLLRATGYEVYEAWSLASARMLLPSVKPSIVVLDLQLGDEDAGPLVEEMTSGGAAVLVVSADGRVNTRVKCLSAGALDYMVKPVDLREFELRIARIGRLVRRAASISSEINLGPIVVSPMDRTIRSSDGRSVRLPAAELSLLMILLQSRDSVVSRPRLSELLDIADPAEGRKIDKLVSKLRKKLEMISRDVLIESVRHQGYRLLLQGSRIRRDLLEQDRDAFERARKTRLDPHPAARFAMDHRHRSISLV